MRSIDDLPSPKRDRSSMSGRAGWYPYYAGFSASFAEAILDSFAEGRHKTVLDPWNGSGTTTAVTASRGFDGFGFDLNPVMLIVARARLLNKRERPSLMPLARLFTTLPGKSPSVTEDDPLSAWFSARSVASIRRIEHALQKSLLGLDQWTPMEKHLASSDFSDLSAFFYVALFRTIRHFMSAFRGSNPTWTKLPSSRTAKLQPSYDVIALEYLKHVAGMDHALDADFLEKDAKITILQAASQRLPLPAEAVDFVLSSPPYCTRIDYASATRSELALLGLKAEPFESLRRNLLGTPTVPSLAPVAAKSWGATCERFLSDLHSHPSKASAGYYHKSHCQYFAGVHTSLVEIQRCLKPLGRACLVVQDSFYKNLHNDLPRIYCEMASGLGLRLAARRDFPSKRNLGQVNSHSRRYRGSVFATESVLLFTKNG
jgi:SAM-dependent methyltransferase